MTKHTPGLWAVGYPDDQTIRADGLRVASVECPRKEWRANACLIAAAPVMLNALLDVLDFWDDPNMSMSELKDRVRDAVATALGEG